MNHADQSALVVVDHAARPVAVITEGDLLRAVAHGAEVGRDRIDVWMNHDPPTIGPGVAASEGRPDHGGNGESASAGRLR